MEVRNCCSVRCVCDTKCIEEHVKRHYEETLFSITEITLALGLNHGSWRLERQIKRILRRIGLGRRGQESSEYDIVPAVISEIGGSSRRFGTRLMHQVLCIKHQLTVRRQTVRDVMEMISPETIARNKRRRLKRREYYNSGPNHVVHIDGYDKLATFGFFIHGAIDGWSRKVLWLDVGGTNKDPRVVAHYFLDYALSIDGIPMTARMDRGTENGLLADIQALLMQSTQNQHYPSYIFGRSVANQRIEKFWEFCYQEFALFWIDLFMEMEMCGLYNPAEWRHRILLQFCFTPVIRCELIHLSHTWNNHKVCKMKNALCPSGIPESLYSMPELYFCNDKKNIVLDDLINVCREASCSISQYEYGCHDEVAELLLELMLHFRLKMPLGWWDSLDLYGQLLIHLEQF